MINDLEPCACCGELFGRYKIGYVFTYIDKEEVNFWASNKYKICVLCKRNPALNGRWVNSARKRKIWKKKKLTEPNLIRLSFKDVLATEINEVKK